MKFSSSLWRALAALALISIFATQVYRAATQSITVDEARVYLDFLRKDAHTLLSTYDAAHHVLQTYLSWLFIRWWGDSEFVQRLPSVLACALYLAFTWRLCDRLLGAGPLFFASTLMFATSLLMLDHLAIARGYGLAIALLGWALLSALEFMDTGSSAALLLAGLLSGLSVAANLTTLWPVAGLWLMLAVHQWRVRREDFSGIVNGGIGPGAVLCALVVMLPMSSASPHDHFYFGALTLRSTLDRILVTHFDRDWWGTPGMLLAVSFTLLAAATIIGGLVLGYRRGNWPALLSIGTLATGMLAIVAAHVLIKVPYPLDRTSLWIVFLIQVCIVTALAQLPDRGWTRFAAIACLLAFAATQLAQYDPRSGFEWRLTGHLARIMGQIRDREATRTRKYKVTGNWEYAYPVDYYRERWKLSNMADFMGGGPKAGADYYILYGAEREAVETFRLKVVSEDTTCQCLLASR